MAKIKAFKGYRYNEKKVNNIGTVVTPLYDTISKEEQKKFYDINEYNIVRVTRGLINDNDDKNNNVYKRASDYINNWIKEDILVQDKEPCLYLYEQRLNYKDTIYVNHGIVALLELSETEDNKVLTCGETDDENMKDRYNLISNIRANIDMINCMYMDPEKTLSSIISEISDKKPDMEFLADEKVINSETTHKIWIIKDKKTIDFIIKNMEDKTFFIADGHNRYETATQFKNYCKEYDKNYTTESDCNYIVAFCSNAYGNRMVQLPVHRVLSTEKKFSEDFFLACAQDNFKLEKIIVDTSMDEIPVTIKKQIATMRKETRIGVYFGGNYFYRLTLTNKEIMKKYLSEKSDAYCEVDVSILNRLVLEDILNINDDNMDKFISYTKRSTEAVDMVKNNKATCAFILNPVKAEQIREVALSNDTMPERSIYIFPKPATGVIISKF